MLGPAEDMETNTAKKNKDQPKEKPRVTFKLNVELLPEVLGWESEQSYSCDTSQVCGDTFLIGDPGKVAKGDDPDTWDDTTIDNDVAVIDDHGDDTSVIDDNDEDTRGDLVSIDEFVEELATAIPNSTDKAKHDRSETAKTKSYRYRPSTKTHPVLGSLMSQDKTAIRHTLEPSDINKLDGTGRIKQQSLKKTKVNSRLQAKRKDGDEGSPVDPVEVIFSSESESNVDPEVVYSSDSDMNPTPVSSVTELESQTKSWAGDDPPVYVTDSTVPRGSQREDSTLVSLTEMFQDQDLVQDKTSRGEREDELRSKVKEEQDLRSLGRAGTWGKGNIAASNHGNTASNHGNTANNHGNTASNHGNTANNHGNTANNHGNTASNHGNTANNHGNTAAKDLGNIVTNIHGNTANNHGNTANNHGNTANNHGNTASNHGNIAAKDLRNIPKV
ncbi:putative uncharacterized protein DDB_G0279653 [Physella acuta]|uniref:putative uncharacterized protein DDB_G0279653 n=1 Tax=Physella acuta TaxID=109671 RepID=UPI0027DB419D|nr:putative uncharacterized protein DDB_G0279653 [Physella acuta]